MSLAFKYSQTSASFWKISQFFKALSLLIYFLEISLNSIIFAGLRTPISIASNIGEITAEERDRRSDQIDDMRDWMEIQDFYVYLFAPLFINLGLIFITIGFIGFGINNSLEERTRRASILIAAAIIFIVLVLQSVGLSITIT